MRERAEPSKAVFSLGGLSVQELARWVVREFQQLECPALACDRRAADRLHGPRPLPRPGCRAAVAVDHPRIHRGGAWVAARLPRGFRIMSINLGPITPPTAAWAPSLCCSRGCMPVGSLFWWGTRSTPKLNTRRPVGKILAKKRHRRPLLCAVAQPYRASGVDMPLAVQDTFVAPLERVGTAWNDVHRIT
jgi:hypothetical protein